MSLGVEVSFEEHDEQSTWHKEAYCECPRGSQRGHESG